MSVSAPCSVQVTSTFVWSLDFYQTHREAYTTFIDVARTRQEIQLSSLLTTALLVPLSADRSATELSITRLASELFAILASELLHLSLMLNLLLFLQIIDYGAGHVGPHHGVVEGPPGPDLLITAGREQAISVYHV